MVYEYARESTTLLRIFEDCKEAVGAIANDGSRFELIRDFSEPFWQIIKAMGPRPSLEKPWKELSSAARKKIVKGTSMAPVRFALEWEIQYTLGKDPVNEFGKELSSRIPVGPSVPARLICLMIDGELPKSKLLKQINHFLDKNLHSQGRRGRGAQGDQEFRLALRDLAVLRILSTRSIEKAKTESASLHEPLFPKFGGERTWRGQIKRAQTTFKQLFPGLFIFEGARVDDEMISYTIYKNNHMHGGNRIKKAR
jgi:hypothetical protein